MKKKCLIEKLQARMGETISETLVALLISSLALVMLAAMINTTVRLVTTSKETMNNYYEESAGLESISPGLQGTVTITYGSMTISKDVVYDVNSELGQDVVAYKLKE